MPSRPSGRFFMATIFSPIYLSAHQDFLTPLKPPQIPDRPSIRLAYHLQILTTQRLNQQQQANGQHQEHRARYH
jgi:hypothetical protein